MSVLLQGILAVICASLLLGVIPSVNKFILLSGMTSACIVFYTYLTSALGALLLSLARRTSLRVGGRRALLLILTGFTGLGLTGFLLNLAYELIPVGLTTMLHFLYPSLVSVALAVFFRERMSRVKKAAIALSVCGMFFIANLSGGIRAAGIAVALCSSLTYACYFLLNERSCISTVELPVKLFYMSLGSGLMFGLLTLCRGEFSLPASPTVIFLLFGLLGLGSLLAFSLITYGIGRAGAATASFLNMLEPITSLAVSCLIYQDRLSPASLIGCALVLSSIFLAARDGVAKESAKESG